VVSVRHGAATCSHRSGRLWHLHFRWQPDSHRLLLPQERMPGAKNGLASTTRVAAGCLHVSPATEQKLMEVFPFVFGVFQGGCAATAVIPRPSAPHAALCSPQARKHTHKYVSAWRQRSSCTNNSIVWSLCNSSLGSGWCRCHACI
jgi:hypothetical protein